MFIKATNVKFLDGVKLQMTFIDGKIVEYDMSTMFSKYPQLKELERNRKLFESGYLDPGGYGVIWNDDLDFDATSIHEEGKVVGTVPTTLNEQLGFQITLARESKGMTQVDLAKKSKIDQADISKLERGQGNPSLEKIKKILDGLDMSIELKIVDKK